MVALKLESFGGMIPAVDEGLLPQNQAALSQNAWVYTGAIEGMRQGTEVYTLLNPSTRKVYRIPIEYYDKDHIPDSYWLEFSDPDVDVVRAPTVNDTFERYYWAGRGVLPSYNTKARIAAGNPAFKLGVPAPITAPGVSVTGGVAPTDTRAYVYTYVSAYGEEGPPSPPTLFTGNASGTWDITVSAPGALATERNLAFTNIYRTVTGVGGATTYFFVAQIPIATLTYADTVPSVTVTGNAQLQSTLWSPPPDTLVGLAVMPNGILAGWTGSDVWFCEPYRPHAWPSAYTLSLEYPIVGMGVIGQTLIVLTTNSPYAISGVNPAAMSVSRYAASEPCLSRGSILSTPAGVAYASPNGLAVVVPGAVQIVTRRIINKDQWLDPVDFLNVPSLRASSLNGGYYCWGSVTAGSFQEDTFQNDAFLQQDFTGSYSGAFIDINDARISYTKLASADPTYNCFTDTWTGEVLVIRNGKVYWIDLAVQRPRESFIWRSKLFEMPNQRNLEAMRVYFTVLPDTPALNPVRNTAAVQELAPDQWGLVRVYADGALKFTRELRKSGELFRLPSGFKATDWQVEVEARVRINSIEIATSAKELISV